MAAEFLRITLNEAISRGRRQKPDHFVNPQSSAPLVLAVSGFLQPLYHASRSVSAPVLLKSGRLDLSCVMVLN